MSTFPEVQREHCHSIPAFDIPAGWYRNESMCDPDRTEIGLRSADWRYHIDLRTPTPLGDSEGVVATLSVQVGGSDSFETRELHRLTDIEPGAVQDAVHLLVGKAIADELEEVTA
jgi:hypothetical protein